MGLEVHQVFAPHTGSDLHNHVRRSFFCLFRFFGPFSLFSGLFCLFRFFCLFGYLSGFLFFRFGYAIGHFRSIFLNRFFSLGFFLSFGHPIRIIRMDEFLSHLGRMLLNQFAGNISPVIIDLNQIVIVNNNGFLSRGRFFNGSGLLSGNGLLHGSRLFFRFFNRFLNGFLNKLRIFSRSRILNRSLFLLGRSFFNRSFHGEYIHRSFLSK